MVNLPSQHASLYFVPHMIQEQVNITILLLIWQLVRFFTESVLQPIRNDVSFFSPYIYTSLPDVDHAKSIMHGMLHGTISQLSMKTVLRHSDSFLSQPSAQQYEVSV